MKKQKKMKTLALMGMTAGMLLNADKAEAAGFNDEVLNNANGSYMAAGCKGGSCKSVAERSPSGGYYQASSHGCSTGGASQGYYNGSSHGCSTGGASHGCSTGGASQGYYNGSSHGCSSGGTPQGYYDASAQGSAGYQSRNNQSQQMQMNQQTQQTQQPTKNTQPQQGASNQSQNSNKWQASNGCGGAGGHGCNHGTGNTAPQGYYNPNQVATADTKVTAPKLNEADLKARLNTEAKVTYDSLSPEGKALALKLANAECKGQNDCKGLNSCKEPGKNDCAGKAGCKGQSMGPFKDKNVAVKVAAAKMAEKRNGLQNKK